MDSDALNTFLVVHRRGGISNAAKALHRSQPAISRRIALLEQELGVPLFERVAGKTRLSDAGRVMRTIRSLIEEKVVKPVDVEAAGRLLNGAALSAALWVAAADDPRTVLNKAVDAFRQLASGLLLDAVCRAWPFTLAPLQPLRRHRHRGDAGHHQQQPQRQVRRHALAEQQNGKSDADRDAQIALRVRGERAEPAEADVEQHQSERTGDDAHGRTLRRLHHHRAR